MTLSLDPVRTAVLFLDFQVDICMPGGRMVSQDEPVLARFAAARAAAARLLAAVRARGADGPRPLFVMHAHEAGDPLGAGAHHRSGMEQYVAKVGAFVLGDPGTAIVPELAPREGEPVIVKQALSAFVGTPLNGWLARHGIDTVVIAGVVTHYAVMSAAISAHDLGYRAVVASDASTSASAERHDTALDIMRPLADVATVDEIVAALGA